jgi:hypothetical protein
MPSLLPQWSLLLSFYACMHACVHVYMHTYTYTRIMHLDEGVSVLGALFMQLDLQLGPPMPRQEGTAVTRSQRYYLCTCKNITYVCMSMCGYVCVCVYGHTGITCAHARIARMYVCMYVCMCVCVCVCVCSHIGMIYARARIARMYECPSVCMYVWPRRHYLCTCKNSTHVCMYVCMYVCMCVVT